MQDLREKNITWWKWIRNPHVQKLSLNMSRSQSTLLTYRRCLLGEVVKIKSWLELRIPKLWLNLGPIISASAAKGNFLTSPYNSHHL